MLFIIIHFMCLVFAPVLLIITIPLHIIMAGFKGNKKVARESTNELQAIKEELQAIRKQGGMMHSQNMPVIDQPVPETRKLPFTITFSQGFWIGVILFFAASWVYFRFV